MPLSKSLRFSATSAPLRLKKSHPQSYAHPSPQKKRPFRTAFKFFFCFENLLPETNPDRLRRIHHFPLGIDRANLVNRIQNRH